MLKPCQSVQQQGEVLISVNEGKTTAQIFLLFITKSVTHFDMADTGWRAHMIAMLDNAAYHRSQSTQAPIEFLGPYEFRMAPVENLFSFFKS